MRWLSRHRFDKTDDTGDAPDHAGPDREPATAGGQAVAAARSAERRFLPRSCSSAHLFGNGSVPGNHCLPAPCQCQKNSRRRRDQASEDHAANRCAGGAEQGKETGKTEVQQHHETGPLPFLSQNDIDELARRGMPEKRPGDDSVTLDTDEFKFMSYNRWLKVKVEQCSVIPSLRQYPDTRERSSS